MLPSTAFQLCSETTLASSEGRSPPGHLGDHLRHEADRILTGDSRWKGIETVRVVDG
jgi:hypothetical protein